MSAETPTGPLAASLRSALLLGIFALAGVALVAGTYQLSHERIAQNQQEQKLRSLHEILADTEYDNDLLADTLRVSAPVIGGNDAESLVYRARQNGRPVAVIMEVVARDGYSGAIHLLVGIYASGEIAGVRVVAHRETPGLGDDIELSRSRWILEFDGKSLRSPASEGWAVKRDGGEFDQFTGATITPRAVVKAVRNALVYVRSNKADLFAGTSQ